jgi:hypothetical protein
MSALVAVETILLVLLIVLVAGLLRSHAEILRRLGPSDDVPAPPARPRAADGAPAPMLAGSTPHGDAVALSFDSAGGSPTLLAFLTSGCGTCHRFWAGLGDRRLPAHVQTVIVTQGAEQERPARLRELAPPGVPVVMSSEAWRDYRVPGAPYFVLVDRTIKGEGVASTWHAVASLVTDAIEDELEFASQHPGGTDGNGRARRVDETLAAAGIGPDHPSLYPAGRPPSE